MAHAASARVNPARNSLMSLGAATPSWASIHFKSDLEVGDAIGRAVAGKGHRRATTDGAQ